MPSSWAGPGAAIEHLASAVVQCEQPSFRCHPYSGSGATSTTDGQSISVRNAGRADVRTASRRFPVGATGSTTSRRPNLVRSEIRGLIEAGTSLDRGHVVEMDVLDAPARNLRACALAGRTGSNVAPPRAAAGAIRPRQSRIAEPCRHGVVGVRLTWQSRLVRSLQAGWSDGSRSRETGVSPRRLVSVQHIVHRERVLALASGWSERKGFQQAGCVAAAWSA
jgi:hypothetical protein